MFDDKPISSWAWGEYRRSFLSELRALDPTLDRAVVKRLEEQLDEIYREEPPSPLEGRRGRAMCALHGGLPSGLGFVVAWRRPGRESDFEWVYDADVLADQGTILCRTCMHPAFEDRDRDLDFVRAVTARMGEASRYLPIFDRIEALRAVRGLPDAVCSICSRRGPALNGVDAVVCWACLERARTVFRAELDRAAEEAKREEEQYDGEVRAYLAELTSIGEEEARAAMAVREASERPAQEGPVGKGGPVASLVDSVAGWWRRGRDAVLPRGGIEALPVLALRLGALQERLESLAPKTALDRDTEFAIDFLDEEIERAVRHRPSAGDLMGNRGKIEGVLRALGSTGPRRRDLLQRLLVRVSMLHKLVRQGIEFYDYTGDELIHEEISAYRSVCAHLSLGLVQYAWRAERDGTLLITGGDSLRRAAAATEIHSVLLAHATASSLFGPSVPFQYCEVETLYSMSEEEQAEVRRRMLVTPPFITVFGAESVDRFIEETPVRAKVRFVTYFFMNGQEPLDLDRAGVYVSTRFPKLRCPTR